MPELSPKQMRDSVSYPGRPGQFNKKTLNDLIAAVPRVISGDGVLMKKISDKWVIEAEESIVYPAEEVRYFVILTEQTDYLTGVIFHFTNQPQAYVPTLATDLQDQQLTGTVMNIAKPWWLQQTPFLNTILLVNGKNIKLTYQGNGSRLYSEVADDGTTLISTTKQTVTPSYFMGDIIAAKLGPTGMVIDNNPISWMDINTAARIWQDTPLDNIPPPPPDNPCDIVLSIITDVCFTITGGNVTAITKERRSICFPAGTVIGDPTCDTTSTGCCPDPGTETNLICGCKSVPATFCVSIPGLLASGCKDTQAFADTNILYYATAKDSACTWSTGVNGCCVQILNGPGIACPILSVSSDGTTVTFTVTGVFLSAGIPQPQIIAVYTASAIGWDCNTALALTRQTPVDGGVDSLGLFSNWPATVTIAPCSCAGKTPTVIENTGDIVVGGSITIKGTGFNASSVVTLSSGACTISLFTSTSITIDFIALPSLGPLLATVTTDGCSSGTPVEIANIVSGGSGSVTFTADGTWTVPSGVVSALFKMTGPGADGNWVGGGGGAYAEKTVVVVPGNIWTISVPAGNAGTATQVTLGGIHYGKADFANGQTGGSNANCIGDLSFSGGDGGNHGGTGTAGGGGGGEAACDVMQGVNGTDGDPTTGGFGGTGGPGADGGNGGAGGIGVPFAPGSNGSAPGGGGGGRGGVTGNTNGTSGRGQVDISW